MNSVRLMILFFVAMILQWWLSTHFSVFGLSPMLLLVLTVAIAARSGPVAGMCCGFAWGLFLDILRPNLFGANALALTLVAYGTGSARRQIDVIGPAPQAGIVFLMTWAYFLTIGMLGLIFAKTFLWVGWKAFLLDPFYNCLLVPVVHVFLERGGRRP